jgi:hypothetical protein
VVPLRPIPPTGRNGSCTNYIRDALGGIRIPSVAAPVSTLSGIDNPPDGPGIGSFCLLFGISTPFSTAQLQTLYPTHRSCASHVTGSAEMAEQQGFCLPAAPEKLSALPPNLGCPDVRK